MGLPYAMPQVPQYNVFGVPSMYAYPPGMHMWPQHAPHNVGTLPQMQQNITSGMVNTASQSHREGQQNTMSAPAYSEINVHHLPTATTNFIY